MDSRFKSSSIKIKLSDLVSNPRPVKTHTKQHVEKLVKSMSQYGYIQNIVIDEDNVVLIGNGRLEALKELDEQEVSVTKIVGMSKDDKQALAILDNKIPTDNWIEETLSEDLPDLVKKGLFTDFTPKEIEDLLKPDVELEEDPALPLGPKHNEKYDYILLMFKSNEDFLFASQLLELKVGRDRMKRKYVGLLRAVDGLEAIEKIRGVRPEVFNCE